MNQTQFLWNYLDKGYREIYVLDGTSDEKGDWYGTETAAESALAKRDSKFYRLSLSSKTKFGPKSSRHVSIAEREITEIEFEKERTASGTDRADNLAEISAYEKREMEIAQAKSIKEILNQSAPKCPTHELSMDLICGPKKYFWGCPKHPKCNEKVWINGKNQELAQRLSSLPPVD